MTDEDIIREELSKKNSCGCGLRDKAEPQAILSSKREELFDSVRIECGTQCGICREKHILVVVKPVQMKWVPETEMEKLNDSKM